MVDFQPRVVGFLCNWCSYAAADMAGDGKLIIPDSFVPIRVMCSSRLDSGIIISALLGGADGILVAGCHPGDCHYEKGNYYAKKRIDLLCEIMQSLGLERERLQIIWVSASEGKRFASAVNEFVTRIEGLGPNPLARKSFT